MKKGFLIAGSILALLTACKRNNELSKEPSPPLVSGSYGDAGRNAGVPNVQTNRDDTNLLTTPENPLHRVAK